MSVKIRLKRFGARNRLQWRIVVADSKSPRDGRFIEEIGSYDPLPMDEKIVVQNDRLDYWVEQGAQMSERVRSLVKRAKKKQKTQAA